MTDPLTTTLHIVAIIALGLLAYRFRWTSILVTGTRRPRQPHTWLVRMSAGVAAIYLAVSLAMQVAP